MAVLFAERLVVLDLKTEELLPFELPHGWEVHSSCVTCVRRYNTCTQELFAALRATSHAHGASMHHSHRPWPLAGKKTGGSKPLDFPELIVTGHADGTVCFWKETRGSPSLLLTLRLPSAASEITFALPSGGGLWYKANKQETDRNTHAHTHDSRMKRVLHSISLTSSFISSQR